MGLFYSKSSNHNTAVSPEQDQNVYSSCANAGKILHNKLLYITIAIDYLDGKIDNGVPEKRFRAFARNYVDDPLSNNAKDVTALLKILENKGHIGLGDYDILKDIVKFDSNIINEIVDTELALQSHGIPIYFRVEDGTVKKLREHFVNRGKRHIVYVYSINSKLVYITHLNMG